MELQGAIEPGSMAKLRQQAKDAQNHSLKSVQMLSNAMSPVVNIDQFLPRPGTPGGTSDKDALTKKPVLIACADEERKQQLVPHELSLPAINIILTFTFLFYIYIYLRAFKCQSYSRFVVIASQSHLRVKWINQLAYGLRLRVWRKQDYHHRSVNDGKLAVQSCGLWGTVSENSLKHSIPSFNPGVYRD